MDPRIPNEELLQAVRTRNLSLIDELLEYPDLDLNYQTSRGTTMLFEALLPPANTEIFVRLLHRGYSIEGRNRKGYTLLHEAVQYCPAEIVHELIKRGANINVYDNYNRTPLGESVRGELPDLEIVCMLLYYGADVHGKGDSALVRVIGEYRRCQSVAAFVAKVLFRHTDLELSDAECSGTWYSGTTLYNAVKFRSSIALEILSIVNTKNERCEELLELALEYDTAEVFRAMWNLFRDVVIPTSFITTFFGCNCKFSNEEWLEILNILLNSPCIRNVYQRSFVNELDGSRFMYTLLDCLWKRGIEPDIRLDIITFFVGLGVPICEADLNTAQNRFSFNDELRFLIFTYNYQQQMEPRRLHYELRTLFTLEDKTDIVYRHCAKEKKGHVLRNALGHFAIRQDDRILVLECVAGRHWRNTRWVERLKQIPEMPSLVEASRNEVMRAAKKMHNITKAYQYLEFVEKSNLPPLIEDILLFKIKIYVLGL